MGSVVFAITTPSRVSYAPDMQAGFQAELASQRPKLFLSPFPDESC
jgi:hypothetical protein